MSENGGSQTVTVTASLVGSARTVATDVTVSVGGGESTAGAPADHGAVSSFTITIPVEATSKEGTFSLAPVDDTIAEGSETVVVSGSATGLTGDAAELTITDDDAAPTAISLSLAPDSVSEDGGSQMVTVTASLVGSTRTVATEVSVSVSDGTAVSPVDYNAVGDVTITIPAGSASAMGSFAIAPANDIVAESDETIEVSGSATGLTGDTAELTITDNDAEPTAVSVSLDPDSVSEDGGSQTVTVTASLVGSARTVATDVTVSIGTADDGATEGTDYPAVADFAITIPQGSTSATGTFSLAPANDDLAEGPETIVVSGSATGLTSDTADLTITDDDARGVTVTPTELTVIEGSSASYTVVLTSQPTADVKVAVTLPEGTDLSISSTSLTFAAGTWNATQTVTVSAAEDADAVADEAVKIGHSATGGDYGTETADVVVTITEKDAPAPELTLTLAAPTHDDIDGSGDVTLGDVLSYAATATNSGNVPLANVTVSDRLVDDNGVQCASLDLDETCKLTGDYTVTQSDVDAGEVANTVTAAADEASERTASRTTTVAQQKVLTLTKKAGATHFSSVGDQIAYSYTVTNGGTVTLTGAVAVTDDKIPTPGITCGAVPAAGLSPGASVTCRGSYTVMQADVDISQVENKATATLDGVTSNEATARVTRPQLNEDIPVISISPVQGPEDGGHAELHGEAGQVKRTDGDGVVQDGRRNGGGRLRLHGE